MEVNLIAVFSILLVLIWHAYNQHVNLYVMASIKRLHEIELELRNMGFDVRLHYSIAKIKQWWRGSHITFFLLFVMFSVWILRVIFSWVYHIAVIGVFGIIPVIMYLVLMILVLVTHTKILNVRNWGKEIEEIIKKR